MKLSRPPQLNFQQGVVIIEALIAILIFSVGVLGIVGMQANMVKNTAASEYRAEASYVAQQIVGAMWADMSPAANLDNYAPNVAQTFPVALPLGISISTILPNGQLLVRRDAVVFDQAGVNIGGTFTIRVGWTAPGEIPAADNLNGPCFMTVAHCYTTTVTIS